MDNPILGKHKCFSPINSVDDLCEKHFLEWLQEKQSNHLSMFNQWIKHIESPCGEPNWGITNNVSKLQNIPHIKKRY